MTRYVDYEWFTPQGHFNVLVHSILHSTWTCFRCSRAPYTEKQQVISANSVVLVVHPRTAALAHNKHRVQPLRPTSPLTTTSSCLPSASESFIESWASIRDVDFWRYRNLLLLVCHSGLRDPRLHGRQPIPRHWNVLDFRSNLRYENIWRNCQPSLENRWFENYSMCRGLRSDADVAVDCESTNWKR